MRPHSRIALHGRIVTQRGVRSAESGVNLHHSRYPMGADSLDSSPTNTDRYLDAGTGTGPAAELTCLPPPRGSRSSAKAAWAAPRSRTARRRATTSRARSGAARRPAADAVLLCVPDAEIAAAAAAVRRVRAADRPHERRHAAERARRAAGAEAFAPPPAADLHRRRRRLRGLRLCHRRDDAARARHRHAHRARPRHGPVRARPTPTAPAYHAAASIASNFLVTIEAAAEQVAAAAGRPRAARAARAAGAQTVENWAALGPERALTGPVARGDEATVERQRAAVDEIGPGAARAVRRAGGRDRAPAAPTAELPTR